MFRMSVFIFSIACQPPLEKKQSLYGEGSSDDPLADLSGLPTLTNRIDTTYCNDAAENLGGAIGATTYYTGTYVLVDGVWIGREKWLLFPNPYWSDVGGETCEVVWEMSASETELENCLACDVALSVSLSLIHI